MSYNKGTGAKFKVGGLSISGKDLNATSTELNDVADLSGNGAIYKAKVVSIVHAAATTEVDTTYDLPSLAIVSNVLFECTAAASSATTLEVGLFSSSSGGDADGFLDAILVDTTGIKLGAGTASSSGSPDYFWATNTLGVFLSTFNAGTTAASDFGVFAPKAFATDSVTAKSLTYTINSTGTAFAGRIVILYTELSS